jgi:hypothetical protein
MSLTEAIKADIAAAQAARIPVSAPINWWREALDRCPTEWRERISIALKDADTIWWHSPTGDVMIWAHREEWDALSRCLSSTDSA